MNLLPKPNGTVNLSGESYKPALPITYAGECPFAAQFALTESAQPVLTFAADPTLPAEGYRLTVSEEHIVVTSADEAGAYYAVQSIFQFLETDGELPCGTITDAPKYHHRGFMLDVGRHFFSAGEIKKLLAQCAKLKLNVFHWHLSEDQGFRIESKKFPKLNEIGSHLGESSGFYTQEEIKEVVAFAAERHIMVIPEIDLPGHTSAIIAAYPQLSCTGKVEPAPHQYGIFEQILCAGNEKVYDFLFALLDEVCALFPSPYFHIGGDEAPKSYWKNCPHCQAEMQKLGLQNEEELQAHFTARLADYLATKGKAVIGWNEILTSGTMRSDAIAQYWTDDGKVYSAAEAAKGRKFIFSNVMSFYFSLDYPIATIRSTYEYEPHIPCGEEIPAEQVLGLECALWTEHIADNELVERRLFPRLAIFAENAWSKEKDFESLTQRIKKLEPLWERDGVTHLTIEEADDTSAPRAAAAVLHNLLRWEWNGETNPATGERKLKPELIKKLPQLVTDTLPARYYTAEQKQEILTYLQEKVTQ